MTLSTHYTTDALESIFATAQKAEFMGIISAHREHTITDEKDQPLSEQENYQHNFWRHKFLGLMLNERDIACASFCALSRKASSHTSGQKVDSGAGVDSGVESKAESKVDSRGENQAGSAEVDSSLSPSSSPQSDTKYEWYFYLVWSENASDGIEIGKLGRACGNAYYLSSGGVMHGFAPHKRGIALKPYIGKRRISPRRAINMLHR